MPLVCPLALLLLAALASAPALAETRPKVDAFGYPRDFPNKLAIRQAVPAKKWQRLERELSGYQLDFERDYRNELRVAHAFDAFRHLDERSAAALEDWQAEAPDSNAARVALAHYYISEAWRARGGALASKTSQKQFVTMRAFAQRAQVLLEEALDRDPGLAVAHEARIEIARATSDRELARAALDEALTIEPLLFGVREAYMRGQARRWGGSYDALEQFARGAQVYAERNPRLRLLLGLPDWDRGWDIARNDRRAAAEVFTTALVHGRNWMILERRAWVRENLGEIDQALEDLDLALQQHPQLSGLLYRRGRARGTVARLEEARVDLELAVQLDPRNEDYRKTFRWVVWRISEEQQPAPARWIWRTAAFLFRNAAWGGVALLAWWLVRKVHRARSASPTGDTLAIDPTQPLGYQIWRAYVWIICLIHLLEYSGGWKGHTAVDLYADIPITVIAIAGAIGFIQRWRLVNARLWRLWAWVFPLWNLVFWTDFGKGNLELWPVLLWMHITLAPIYAALFVYGYRSYGLWGEVDSFTMIQRDATVPPF